MFKQQQYNIVNIIIIYTIFVSQWLIVLVGYEGVLAVVVNSFELPLRVRARRVRSTQLRIRFCCVRGCVRVCVCLVCVYVRFFCPDVIFRSINDVDFILQYCSALLLCYYFNRFSSLAVRNIFGTFCSALNYTSKAIWWLRRL